MIINLERTDLIIKKEKVANLCFEINTQNIKEQILNLVYSDAYIWRTLKNEANGHSLFIFDSDENIFLHSHSNKTTKEDMVNELVEQIKKNNFGLGGGLSINMKDISLKWNSDSKLFAISINFNEKCGDYILKINNTNMINLYDMAKNIRALGFKDEDIDLGNIDPIFKNVYTKIIKGTHNMSMILTTYRPFVEGIRTKAGDWVV